MNLLEAKNLKISLRRHLIIDGVSFDLRPGEVLGLIGPNGAGKSTLMKALVRVIPFQEGRVMIKGRDLKALSLREQARQMAYMPQGAYVHWPLRVSAVVTLGRLPQQEPWEGLKAEDQQAVAEAMADTDVSHLARRTVTRLAGGERTLVMLARALAVRPEILLADEPTNGLDPYHQIQVMELLRGLAESKGYGIMVVLHDLTLAARFCHRLLLLGEGRVLACGNPSEVLSPDSLKKGYGIEARYGGQGDERFVLPWKRLKEKFF